MKRLLLILCVIFIGCSAPIITSNCEESADFDSYKTFCFADYKASTKPARPEYDNPESREIIKQAITNELVKLGYVGDETEADLMIVFDIFITEMVDPRVDSAVIYKPWVDTKIDSFNYLEGLLVVRIIDRDEGKMIWQGSLSGILNRKPERFENRVENHISNLFASLAEHIQ